MIRNTIKSIAHRIAIKNGANPDTFIKRCRDITVKYLTKNELISIVELSMYSVLTSPNMIQYYLGIKASKINWVLYIDESKYENNGMTEVQKQLLEFVGNFETTTNQVIDRFETRERNRKNVHYLISSMVKKGHLIRVKRGVYIVNDKIKNQWKIQKSGGLTTHGI